MAPTTTTSAALPTAATRRLTLAAPATPWDAIVAWVLSFALVLYLALRGGGYDAVIRDQVAVLVWWVVLLVAVAGLLPRLTRAGWVALGLLAALAGWTALGISDSESAERTLNEVGRLSAYVGVLALALALQGRAGSRHVINGVASAVGVVTVLALLSRFHPQWFPGNDQLQFLPSAARRLSYPLNYWNALAGFMAIGAVLLAGVTATARTRLGQGVSGAAVPLAGLGTYLCVSRGGAIVLIIGMVVFFLLTYDRLARAASLLVAGAGTLILVEAASQRDALQTGVDTAVARSQGDEMILLCLLVCGGVGLLQVGINLLARHTTRPAWLRPSRQATTAMGVIALAVLAVGAIALGAPGELSDRFDEFKAKPVAGDVAEGDVFSRLQGTAGQGRWQFWEAARDAYEADPGRGIGAGTFEFYWARNATVNGTIVDTHSLYMQTLAELGWPGLLLLGAFVLLSLGLGVVRAARETGTARVLLAAATAGAAIFWAQAAVEWTWQIAVMPVTLFFLIAVIVGHRSPRPGGGWMSTRVLVVLAAIAAFVPIAIGLSTTMQVRESHDLAQDGRLVDAMNAAKRADRLQGTSATAILQEALLLEQAGALQQARTASIRATDAEPTNWRTWLIRSRLEARLGQNDEALAHFRTARSLNPRGAMFRNR